MNKFKCLILILLFGLAGTLSAFGQTTVDIGVKAGVNISNLNGGPYDLSSRTGLFGGLAFGLTSPSWPVSLESGVYYTQKGAQGEYKETIIKGGYEGNAGTFKLDYIEVPLYGKYAFGTSENLSPYLFAGPYVEFNLNSEVKASKNVAYIEDISAEIQSVGFGVLLGAGLEFDISGRALNLQARYGLGLSPVYQGESDEGEKHGVITIAAGFTF